MKTDKFWRVAWVSFVTFSCMTLAVSIFLFMQHIKSVNAASVNITFDPLKDPFEAGLHSSNFSLVDGAVYKDAMPLGLSDWSWDSTLDWNSSDQAFEGSHSLKISFLADWGGMGLSGFSASRTQFNGLSLAVYPAASVGDMYIEVYDQSGIALVRQSLGFYAPSGSLVPNTWQVITVPLQNLVGASATAKITGFSISTMHPGVAYVDSITFVQNAADHAVWTAPSWINQPSYNPLATSTPTALPYNLGGQGESVDHWFSYDGYFVNQGSKLLIGPLQDKNTDSLAIYRSGLKWDDYQIDSVTDWGLASTFSLIARFKDPQNYVTCAFSYYGQNAQIYDVAGGVSTDEGQTPSLPIPYDEPWKDVSLGMKVEGQNVYCIKDGKVVLTSTLPDIPRSGTVGIDAWDKNTYASPHTVKKFTVSPLGGE